MKSFIVLLCAFCTVLLYQNCSGRHESWDNQNSGSSFNDPNNPISIAAFEKTLHPFLTASGRCVTCHGATQQPLHSQLNASFAHDVIVSYGLVNLANPSQSRFVIKIRGGHSGFGATESTQIESAIQAWANEIIANGGILGATPGVLLPRFSSIKNLILDTKCLSCHSPSGVHPSVDFTDYASTLNTGRVVPFSASSSEMFNKCLSGEMPKSGTPLDGAELNALRAWIDNGAPNN